MIQQNVYYALSTFLLLSHRVTTLLFLCISTGSTHIRLVTVVQQTRQHGCDVQERGNGPRTDLHPTGSCLPHHLRTGRDRRCPVQRRKSDNRGRKVLPQLRLLFWFSVERGAEYVPEEVRGGSEEMRRNGEETEVHGGGSEEGEGVDLGCG